MGALASSSLLVQDLMFWFSLPVAGLGIFAAFLGLLLQKPRGEWRAMVGIIGGLNLVQALLLGFFSTGSTVVAVSILAGIACLALASGSNSRVPVSSRGGFRVTGEVGKIS